jgi:hypothetical protein
MPPTASTLPPGRMLSSLARKFGYGALHITSCLLRHLVHVCACLASRVCPIQRLLLPNADPLLT